MHKTCSACVFLQLEPVLMDLYDVPEEQLSGAQRLARWKRNSIVAIIFGCSTCLVSASNCGLWL